uniref:Cystatin domain-containing protein n=1 Tax=Macrostomum lignano TaxID=282301 RepID=A0A1I8IYV8_9PLAT
SVRKSKKFRDALLLRGRRRGSGGICRRRERQNEGVTAASVGGDFRYRVIVQLTSQDEGQCFVCQRQSELVAVVARSCRLDG